jgi:hypothetical protein
VSSANRRGHKISGTKSGGTAHKSNTLDLPPHTYDRLSVAYGLSYIPDDIGKIVRMEEIPDFTEEEARQGQTLDEREPPLTDRDAWT